MSIAEKHQYKTEFIKDIFYKFNEFLKQKHITPTKEDLMGIIEDDSWQLEFDDIIISQFIDYLSDDVQRKPSIKKCLKMKNGKQCKFNAKFGDYCGFHKIKKNNNVK